MRARRPTTATLLGLLALTGALVWVVGRRRTRRPHRPPMTQALVPDEPADMPLGPPGENLERRLDEALRETFPASDPISVCIE